MRRLLLPCLLLLISLPVFCAWKTLKTEAFTVFFPDGRETEAEEIIGILEYYRNYVGDRIGAAQRKVAIVLEDAGRQSNGLTDVSFHRILLFSSPPSDKELGYHQNWWRLVGVHEYTHWRHLSAAEGLPGLLTAVFGSTVAPANYTPGWLKEGICVVSESGTSAYEGRLNEGLFDAYATVLAQTGSLPTIVQATYNVDAFPGGTGPYLFGGQFVEFLVRKFGSLQVSRFFVHYSASILSYLSPALPAVGLDRSARKVLGESIRSLWLEWQLELIKKSVSFKRPQSALTDHGWWLRSPVFWRDLLYYQRSFPLKPSSFSTTWQHQLMQLDPAGGRSRVLFRSSAPFSGPMRVRSGKLYYALQEIEGGYDNHLYNRLGFTSVLYSRDLESRCSRRLLEEPLRSFEVLEDGMILTAVDRRDTFGSEIRLHDPAGGVSEPLLATEVLVSDIVADAGNIFLAARSDWDNAQIYRLVVPGWSGRGESLAAVDPADIRLEQLHDTPYQEAELCLADGRLFYSATYESKRTLYEHDLGTGAVFKAVGSDYARSPAWDGGSGSLYYIGLNARGEDLYRERPWAREISVPDGALPELPSAAELRIPEDALRRGGYWDNLATLMPRRLFPVFSLGPYLWDYQAGGGIAGRSALGDFNYILLGYYDSAERRPDVEANLQTNVLAPLSASFTFSTAEQAHASQFMEATLTLEWPLYRKLGKGFSYLSVGVTGALQWDALQDEERVLLPFTVLGFQAVAAQTFLQIGVQALQEVATSTFGYILLPGISISVALLGAELSLQAGGLYDLGGGPWNLPWAPPGYDVELSGSWGGYLFSTLSVPLLRLRGGLWNPGLYFGDMFIAPFVGMASNQNRDLQLSYGGMLRLELKAGARDEGFPLVLYAGLGMTLEGLPLVLFGFEIPGYTDGSLGPRRAAGLLQPVSG